MPTVLRANRFKAWSGVGLLLLATLVSAEAPVQKPLPGPASQTPAQSNQWETNEAVRLGMLRIHQAMQAHLADIDNARLKAPDYRRLAQAIEQTLPTMAPTRTGTQVAETALHLVVLVDLKHSLELMHTAPTVELQRVGALGVRQSLRNYGQYFKHPGWGMPQATLVGDAR